MNADAVAVLDQSPLARRVSWLITGLAVVGLLFIVGVTFVTSFEAVSEVAVELGVVNEDLAWSIPVAIDGLIVVGSAVAWLEALRAERWHVFPVTTVAVAGALSVAANIAHAGSSDWLARLLATTPPAGLIVAVELLAWETRRAVRRSLGIDGVKPTRRERSRRERSTAADVVRSVRAEQADLERAVFDPLPDGVSGALPTNGRAKTNGRPPSRAITWSDVEGLPAERRTSERAVQAALDTTRHQVRKLATEDSDRFRALVG